MLWEGARWRSEDREDGGGLTVSISSRPRLVPRIGALLLRASESRSELAPERRVLLLPGRLFLVFFLEERLPMISSWRVLRSAMVSSLMGLRRVSSTMSSQLWRDHVSFVNFPWLVGGRISSGRSSLG